MQISQLIPIKDLTVSDLIRINFNSSVLFIPISPIEVHGFHLPLGQDILWSELQIEIISNDLYKNKIQSYVYPVIPLGSHVYDGKFGFEIRGVTLYRILKNVASAMMMFGFHTIVFANAHGGPFHLLAIEKVRRFVEKKGGNAFHTLPSFIQHGLDHKDIFGFDLRKDLHAGCIETSLALLHWSSFVKNTYRTYSRSKTTIGRLERFIMKQLIPILIPYAKKLGINYDRIIWNEIIDWYFEKINTPYIGYPDKASKEIGEKITTKMQEFFHKDIVQPIVKLKKN